MSVTQVPSLVSFTPGTTILSSDVNSNLTALRNAVNALITGTDTLATGLTVGGPFTITGLLTASSGITTSAASILGGNLTVTGNAVVSGTASVAGAMTITGAVTVTGAAVVGGDVTVGGALSVVGALTVTEGTVGIGAAAIPQVGVGIYTLLTGASGVVGLGIVGSGDSAATTSVHGINLQVKTAASAYTVTTARGLRIFDADQGAGSTITTLVGIEVNAQTKGGTNYAIRTAGGGVQLAGLEAFVASDKYVTIDTSGNLHVSAIGPAS